jgi:hypothetical protein
LKETLHTFALISCCSIENEKNPLLFLTLSIQFGRLGHPIQQCHKYSPFTPSLVCIQKSPNVFEAPWHPMSPLYQNWHRIKIIFAASIFDSSISYQKYFLGLIDCSSVDYDIFRTFAVDKTSEL